LRSFDLGRVLEKLSLALEQLQDVKLVIIDPITAYLGNNDSNNNAVVRGVLAPLSEALQQSSCAVVLVTHFNKSLTQDPLGKVIGSIGLIAAARSGYAVIKDEADPDRRYLLPIKNNIGEDRFGLEFNIEEAVVAGDITTSRVRWHETLVDGHPLLSPKTPAASVLRTARRNFLEQPLKTGHATRKTSRILAWERVIKCQLFSGRKTG